MNKGFTLVELLAVIILLSVLLAFAYPKVLEITEKKQLEISEAKVQLINNAAQDYMNNNINNYTQNIGDKHCILVTTLEDENLIPVDITDVKEKYNYVKIIIGKNKNSYTLVQANDETSCKS